jgi:hypothetical protein
MTKLVWDQTGERRYETGVDHGVLYIPLSGVYGPGSGYSWNGLTTVTESPSGAEATPLYADNIKYLNLQSAEEFGGTIEAYTFPDAFLQCDGSLAASAGVNLGQQARKAFGLSYRTRVGNDVDGSDAGYKLHLIYGAQAAPSEKAYATINDTPEAITFSWEITTTAVPVSTQIGGVSPKPTSLMTIDSTKVDASALATLENALYGTAGADARLPLPDEVIGMFSGTAALATPTQPTFVSPDITIPAVAGVIYKRGDTNAVVPAGPITIPGAAGSTMVIYAVPATGFYFGAGVDDDWMFTKS